MHSLLRFVLGGNRLSSLFMKEILKESSVFKDMMILSTITDTPDSLTDRTIFSLKHAYEALKFDFVLKCDDDNYVDLLRIATDLQQRKSNTPLYWGYMTGNTHTNKIGVYREWHMCDRHITHALGGGYVLSRAAVGILASNVPHLRRYRHDDVSIGTWLGPFNIEWKHDSRFNVNSPPRGCKDPHLIVHDVSSDRMALYHESMMLEGRICSWRTYSYGSSGYIFNWTAATSAMCCEKNSFVP